MSPSMLIIVASQTGQFVSSVERREITEERDLEQYYCVLQETLFFFFFKLFLLCRAITFQLFHKQVGSFLLVFNLG